MATNDPQLSRLEAALETQQRVSADAQSLLVALAHREVEIANTPRPNPPQYGTMGWTLEAFMEHSRAIREADFRFYEERDRRYAEVNVEKEKALKIKETADLAALQLAREIQTYKDEKANELREQIGSERNLYATKAELAAEVRSLERVVVGGEGRQRGQGLTVDRVFQLVTALLAMTAILAATHVI